MGLGRGLLLSLSTSFEGDPVARMGNVAGGSGSCVLRGKDALAPCFEPKGLWSAERAPAADVLLCELESRAREFDNRESTAGAAPGTRNASKVAVSDVR